MFKLRFGMLFFTKHLEVLSRSKKKINKKLGNYKILYAKWLKKITKS